MASGGHALVGTPDARTRSVWLTQLVLGASVVITCVLVLALQPGLFARWYFAAGMLALIVITIATLALPWAQLPRPAVLAIPFADAVAIGFVASDSDLRFAYMWVFPVLWVAMHGGAIALGALYATVGGILLIDSTLEPGAASALRIFIVTLSLIFLGITAQLALRHTRALRRLLRRQAGRLTTTLERRSAQERRTTEILNGIDTGIVRLSSGGRVITANDAYTKLYALDPRDLTLPARSVEYTALRGMPVPMSERPFARAARGETFTDASVWLFTPDGEWHALSVTAKRLAAGADEEPSILLLVHDVTAITHAQRERERLTAMASHELKHPLTVMLGNAELALEIDELTPRTRERFEAILRASERMLEMTNSMLSSSRGRSAAGDAFDEIDLRPIVLDSVASFDATAIANDVRIDVDAVDPLRVTADGFRLRQVVDNIVSNAIKYTPRDGQVRVVAAAHPDAVSLVVSDTGIGIAAEDLPNIMTPYFRTERARETAGGTGLGLGITNAIVAAHGGTLTIDSEPGVGTTVSVRLPRAGSDNVTQNAEVHA